MLSYSKIKIEQSRINHNHKMLSTKRLNKLMCLIPFKDTHHHLLILNQDHIHSNLLLIIYLIINTILSTINLNKYLGISSKSIILKQIFRKSKFHKHHTLNSRFIILNNKFILNINKWNISNKIILSKYTLLLNREEWNPIKLKYHRGRQESNNTTLRE